MAVYQIDTRRHIFSPICCVPKMWAMVINSFSLKFKKVHRIQVTAFQKACLTKNIFISKQEVKKICKSLLLDISTAIVGLL